MNFITQQGVGTFDGTKSLFFPCQIGPQIRLRSIFSKMSELFPVADTFQLWRSYDPLKLQGREVQLNFYYLQD